MQAIAQGQRLATMVEIAYQMELVSITQELEAQYQACTLFYIDSFIFTNEKNADPPQYCFVCISTGPYPLYVPDCTSMVFLFFHLHTNILTKLL
jgi:hypothetical protein